MSVDKFGRRRHYDRKTREPVEASGITLTQMDTTYLRRDGANSALGMINMSGNTLTNVSNPVNDHDAANKEYVD